MGRMAYTDAEREQQDRALLYARIKELEGNMLRINELTGRINDLIAEIDKTLRTGLVTQ